MTCLLCKFLGCGSKGRWEKGSGGKPEKHEKREVTYGGYLWDKQARDGFAAFAFWPAASLVNHRTTLNLQARCNHTMCYKGIERCKDVLIVMG